MPVLIAQSACTAANNTSVGSDCGHNVTIIVSIIFLIKDWLSAVAVVAL